jgi:hypothetical protein
MPSDTGAPWLLPYPEDTDLVRDGAADIEALAVAAAAGLSTADNIKQIVSATDVTLRSTTSTSFVDGLLDITVTPLVDASTLFVIYTGQLESVLLSGSAAGRFVDARLRNTTGSTTLTGANRAFSGVELVSASAQAAPFVCAVTLIGTHTVSGLTPQTFRVEFASGASGVTARLRNDLMTGRILVMEVVA